MLSQTAQRGAMLRYQRAQVESASPIGLIVLLYDGAIRFCSLAGGAMRARNIEAQNTNLIKAQRIVGELLGSLNRTGGGEVAVNLSRIYTHLFEQLVRANLYDNTESLDHVIMVLTEMRASWAEIDRTARSDRRAAEVAQPTPPGRVPAAGAAAGTGQNSAHHPPNDVSTALVSGASGALQATSRLGDRLA